MDIPRWWEGNHPLGRNNKFVCNKAVLLPLKSIKVTCPAVMEGQNKPIFWDEFNYNGKEYS